FTSFMRSPTCDVFNPLHHEVNQDMEQPLCNYFIASSHNTYLTGDQLLSHSKTDMYAWVLQFGCRCVEVDCWDGPDGEPMVQHGYTLTSKITFKSVIETINKYAFINNQYPVILSIENHCSIQQQKKIAQYLREILGDKLDVGDTLGRDSRTLPSPHSLQGKILIKGKRLPAYLSADIEEGEVSDDDSADEIEDDFKLKNSNSNGHHQVESHIRKKLDSLLKESQIGDKEDTDSFSIRALLRATHQGIQKNLRQSSKGVLKKSQSRSFIASLKQKRHSKSRLSCQSVEKEDDDQEGSGREAGGQLNRSGRKRKTMKLSRDLSNLVVFTNSVASQECLNEGTPGDVLSFSETRAQSLVNHRAEQFLAFNQRQLSRIYPSAYRIDSSNFNPQFYWNTGCQLVALNYQTEGRMMQLNRAKFMVNGGSGYVLKPPPMCKGSFNPFSDDPLPAYPKKQLILKIISGQQLPKPPDSMLGDRGEIIDPFVEVEIIGLPVDCCKEQTRVVDDNGFNPVWEETLSFTLHMAEVALVRFLVWDHDPIGRDFVGQRTVAFSSLMPGYRHVYLEGLTEASIFVHVSVHDIYGKWSPLVLNPSFTIMHFLGSNKGRQLRGIRGLFNRSSKSTVDRNSSAALRKRSISDHLLRRTVSAPAKGRKKTKMALAESVASISDRNNSTGAGAGAGGECIAGKEAGVERRQLPRVPLAHRPISMPLDRLLQGQLSLCSPDKEQHDMGADTVIGTCPFDRPRSSSVDVLIESSASIDPSVCSPSKTYINRNKELDQSEETSYLVIGGEARSVDDKDQSEVSGGNKAKIISTGTEKNCFSSPSGNSQRRSNKPETSSNSTTFTVAPSDSSSSYSAASSVAPLSAVSVDHFDLKSPGFLHDSAISRLIDAVSLGNENDTCGSISALIGQFDSTVDQVNLTTLSNGYKSIDHVLNAPSHTTTQMSHTLHQSNFKPTTPSKASHDFMSPLKTTRASNHTGTMKRPISPQKAAQKTNHTNHEILSPRKTSQVDPPVPPLLASPETTEQEEVYTILDEEVLSPTSVYNLKEQTIHLQADSMYSTPSNSLESSPAKVPQGLGKEDIVGWGNIQMQRGGSEEVGEAEESVYEEVYDPTGPVSELEHGVSRTYMGPSLSQNHQLPSSSQPSPFHRPVNSRPSNPSPLRQNSYPIPQNKPQSFDNNKEFSRSYTQQRSYNGSHALNRCHQDRLGDKQMEREAVRCFQNGSSSSESLPGLSGVPISLCNDRGLYSPTSDFDVVYSQVDYDCFTPSSASSASHYTQPPSQCQTQSYIQTQPQNQMFSHINNRHQTLSETGASLQTSLGPFSALPESGPITSKAPSPCKSKSLGDLTSEDISCNFQSKYHIISRSFITPHMTNHKRMGTLGDVTFQSQSSDPLTEQLRKLVTLEGDDSDRDRPQDIDDSPPLLTRRLSSRSQSRVRHINSRARERQQEALKPRPGVVINSTASIGGVVLRNKPASQNPPANRHSTGSYIAGYLGQLEDRGLPEGACTSLRYGYGDHYGDRYYTDDSLPPADSSCSTSEPEVYFLLRL
uniref:1-phosphatidylinositol 4,5-bisphosphate phosphodiesterase eta-1 n=1 Tax=Centroberyx gerrardi TaxID=166262 RepID=UPI003AAE598C